MIQRTVICHFYDEEYLLPWWLKHHRKIFDHGIMINYSSTDSSVALIQHYCPTWQIFDSRNPEFGPISAIDDEVTDYECKLPGIKIALNVTEFLYGNYSQLDELDHPNEFKELAIPVTAIIDDVYNRWYDPRKELIQICNRGVSYKKEFDFRNARSAHNMHLRYTPGRHIRYYNTEDLVIFWHGFSPVNDLILDRKMNIGKRIPPDDVKNGFGLHHMFDKNKLLSWWQEYCNKSNDISDEINRVYTMHLNNIKHY